MLWKIQTLTSEIAFGNFTNFLPSIPHVQNSQEGSQHQVLNRAVGMSKNVASNVSILKIERSGKSHALNGKSDSTFRILKLLTAFFDIPAALLSTWCCEPSWMFWTWGMDGRKLVKFPNAISEVWEPER